MQNTDTPTPLAVRGLPDAAGSAFTPTTEEFLQAIKEGCEELADERNYQIPAWCPGTIAAKLARYADTALMQLRATKPNEWTQQPPETAQKTMDNSDTQESADTAQSTHSEAVGSSAVFAVDDVIRVRCQAGFRVWKVTAVAYGGIGHENLLAIVPLDQYPGSIYGKTVEECLVPLSLLAGVERVVSANYENRHTR